MLHRYWFVFAVEDPASLPPGVRMGCGVTAHTREEAIALVRLRVFAGQDLPRIGSLVEDVDVTTLDAGHIRPNMGNPVALGVWFPQGY